MHSYLITSPDFYTQTPSEFSPILRKQLLKHQPDFALYRDKTNSNYEEMSREFLSVCGEFKKLKAFLHTDYKLAVKLNARGVHLTSTMFDKIAEAKSLGLEVVVSSHTLEDVLFAQNAGADYVTYSPVFASPGKGEPKGVENLEEVLSKVKIKVFALGGIVDEEQINAIEKTSAFGFASIRYFY
jgi:thiamine-phosphate pyrophosphorylase